MSRVPDKRVPRAPWGDFPLSELIVLLALGLGIFGFANLGSAQGTWGIACATTLGCLAGLEVAIREHFSGYRSRTVLLTAAVAAAASAGAMLLRLPPVAALVTALVLAALILPILKRSFTRRAQAGAGSAPEQREAAGASQ